MEQSDQKLRTYISKGKIPAEHLIFEKSCHSVAQAAQAANASPEEFVKNICMIDSNGNLIVAIVKGEHRASTKRVAKALNIERPTIATPDEVLNNTGYVIGAVPSFGYKAIFLIDPKVMEKETVYTGGGSDHSLVKISTLELHKANNGQIIRIRK